MENVLSHYNLKDRVSLVPKAGIVSCCAAFLLGRAAMFEAVAPFGLSFLAAYLDKHPNRGGRAILFAALALAGTWSAGIDLLFLKYLLAFILFGLVYLAVTTITSKHSPYATGLIAAVSLGISGVIFCSQTALLLYDMLMLGVECALCFLCTLMIDRALPMVYSPTGRREVENEDLIAFYVTAAITILGFSGWSVGSISIGSSLAALFIMLVALVGGMTAGAAGGLGVGLIGSFAVFPITELLGVYGFCGLASGILSKFKRPGVILGFGAANGLLSLYLGGFGGNTFTALELAVASVLFCLVPKSFVIELETLLSRSCPELNTEHKSIDLLTQKMQSASLAFHKLASVFSQTVLPRLEETGETATVLYDEAADRVCSHCAFRYACWERDFEATYCALMKTAPQLWKAGRLTQGDLPEEFSNKCIKASEFVKELNKAYAQYRLDRLWQQQVQQSRELVCDQLRGVSTIIDGLAKDLGRQLTFESTLENRLYIALEQIGVKSSDVTVFKNSDQRLEATIRMKACARHNQCDQAILPAASKALGRPMCKREKGCTHILGAPRCALRLVEEERFEVLCGSAAIPKAGQDTCGDSFSYQPITNGKYAIILSDGMGSGSKAARESGATIELMHYFLNAGFDRATAVKMLNSTLMLKAEDECFATLDIALLDLFSGQAEFIKIGANTGYIKRGSHVDKLGSHSLPAGMLTTVDMEPEVRPLRHGDYVILISDGVQDPRDNWLSPFLAGLESTGPQQMSRSILEEAIRRNGRTIEDDMTVITAAIRRKDCIHEETKCKASAHS